MAYSDVQQTEFNRATENLIEITWTYVNLQKEFPKLLVFRSQRSREVSWRICQRADQQRRRVGIV